MKEIIYIALREFCEIKALQFLMDYFQNCGETIQWNLISWPVNTDFDYYSIENAFEKYDNVVPINKTEEQLRKLRIFGFLTDKPHPFDKYVYRFISCAEINACRDYANNLMFNKSGVLNIVVGNIKVKSPMEPFQSDIISKLSLLPYEVFIVPRHPLSAEEISRIEIPDNINFINTIGDLDRLQATANLTIMGRIFSADGLTPGDDHNPLEATINSNTICGVIQPITEAYRWLYQKSGLVYQCVNYDEVFDNIERLINDPALSKKLERRNNWIQDNRKKYIETIRNVLEI